MRLYDNNKKINKKRCFTCS